MNSTDRYYERLYRVDHSPRNALQRGNNLSRYVDRIHCLMGVGAVSSSSDHLDSESVRGCHYWASAESEGPRIQIVLYEKPENIVDLGIDHDSGLDHRFTAALAAVLLRRLEQKLHGPRQL